MSKAVRTIVTVQKRMRPLVLASVALSSIVFVSLACINPAKDGFAAGLYAVAAALLLYCIRFIVHKRISLGMIPLSLIALACSGAAAQMYPLLVVGGVFTCGLILLFVAMRLSYAFIRMPRTLCAIIVLGCAIKDTSPSPTLKKRLDKALVCAKEHPEAIVILSGGINGSNTTEALVMKNYLVEKGLDATRLIMEDHSLTTEQNLANSFAILDEKGIKDPIALISSDFHLMRARLIASQLRRTVIPLAAPTNPQSWLLQWSQEALVLASRLLEKH